MMSFAERCRLEDQRLALLSPSEREFNARSHTIGIVDDCYRCVDCEIGEWNAWKERCPVGRVPGFFPDPIPEPPF
jgi:hypothetical protein